MFARRVGSLLGRSAFAPRSFASVGEKVPNVALHKGFPPEKVMLADFCKGKKVVLVGLPGAFTPTCSSKTVPGYLSKADELKAKGVSDVLVYCVNDGAVMTGWEKAQGTKGSIITMLGDPSSELTQKLDLVLDHPGPMGVLGNPRCKRFAMLIEDGVIKVLNVAASPDDPSGDADPTVSLVDQMLTDLERSG